MSLAAYESSKANGRPVELFEFRYGPGENDFYRYTSAENDITWPAGSGHVYTATVIGRARITSSGNADKTALKVKLSVNSPVVELFRIYAPAYPVILTIRDGHVIDADGDYSIVWTGRVLSCNRNDGGKFQAALTCEPASKSMKRAGLRRHYQYSCPHVLFGEKCGILRADHSFDVAITSAAGTTITMPSGWSGATPYAKFVGGVVNFVGDLGLTQYATILRCPTATTITITGLTVGLGPGSTVTISRGCNHQLDQCRDDFGNVLNYGGDPWIPMKNPIKTNPFT